MSGGGQPARWGFHFSDLVVAHRILEHEVAVLRAKLNGSAAPPHIIIAVESTFPNSKQDWDIQERRAGGFFVVEEVKSGPLSAEHRRVLWKRVRDAVVSDPSAIVVPRLTTDKANPTEHPEFWAALTKQCLTALVGSASTRLTSAENLAAEALYCLTSDDEGFVGTPLTESQARKTLAAFEFVDTRAAQELEGQIEALVELFAKSAGAKQICDALIGDLTRRAASSDVARRQFSPSDIWSSAQLLLELSSFPAAQVHLWQRLKEASEPPQVLPESALPYQDWRTVQPRLAVTLNSAPFPRLALLGRGGLGKTVALARLYDEAKAQGPTLWINGGDVVGVPPGDVAGALAAGAVASGASPRKPFAVFVDGFENTASTSPELSAMLAALGLVNGPQSVRLVLSCRVTTWSSTKGTQEKAAGWFASELEEWNVGLVSQLVNSSQRPSLSAELLRLLQTPLILDLFLRTFGVAEVIPAGLQTRYAILRAFWDRRVLPSSGSDSPERRLMLEEACAAEAVGRSEHLLVGPTAQALASEGVFVARRGTYLFRHPLLRDFALLCWAVFKANSASTPLQVLETISVPLVRWGAIRAAIEAAVAPPALREGFPEVSVLLGQNSVQSLQLALLVADVLGELEDPSGVELTRLASSFPTTFSSQFVDRVVEAATIAENAAWLTWMGSLPDAGSWPDSVGWVSTRFFDLAKNYLEVIARPIGISPATTAVAQRLMCWSEAAKFKVLLAEYDSCRWTSLLPLISSHVPAASTLDWVLANAGRSWRSRWGALEAVPLLLLGLRAQGGELPSDKLVELYLEGAGLTRTRDGIREDLAASGWPNQDYERTTVAFLGQGTKKHRGLLREAPDIFLPVAFERLVGIAAGARDDRAKRWAGFAERFKDADLKPPTTSEIETLEAQLHASAGPKLSIEEALGRLVDDVEDSLSDYERTQLVLGLRSFLAEHLRSSPNIVRDVYWPLARDGRSATALIALLEVLVESHPVEQTLLRDVLLDQRLFHVLKAHAAIHNGIALVWPTIRDDEKRCIVQAIGRVAASPSMNGIYCVAPIMSAIPAAERAPEFEPHFELFRKHGWTPTPTRQRPPQFTYGSSAVDAAEAEETNSSAWRTLFTKVSGDLANVSEAELQGLVDLIGKSLADLPAPGAVAQNPEVFICLERVLNEDMRRHRDKTPRLPEDMHRRIVEWALAVLKENPPAELNGDPSTVAVESAPNSGLQHPFVMALEVLDAALVYRFGVTSRSALFQEVEKHFPNLSDVLAWHLLGTIRSWLWLNAGRATLSNLLERVAGSPGVLSMAVGHVLQFEPDLRARTLEGWLTTTDFLKEGPAGQVMMLCRQIGTSLGYHCASEAEAVQGSARQLVETLFSRTDGALKVPQNRNAFASGVIFGAKERLLRVKPRSFDEVNRFGLVCQAAWNRLQHSDADGQSHCVLYMTHPLTSPLLMESGERAQASIWDALAPVFVQVVEQGAASEVFDLVFQLREIAAALGWQRLSAVVEALITRLAKVDFQAPAPSGRGWVHVPEYASQLLESLARLPNTAEVTKTLIFNALQAWGALGFRKALEAAHRLRTDTST